MSNKSLFKKFVKGSPPKAPTVEPRSKQVINEEYTAIAQQLGAKTVEAESIKRQIQQLINKVDQLGAEMSERTKLDESAAEVKKSEELAAKGEQIVREVNVPA